MKTIKVVSLAVIITLAAFTSQAQQKYDYPQLKNYSPLGISAQGVFYNKIYSHYCQYNGEFYTCSKNAIDLENNKTFSYSIGIDYTFYRANKLSFILNASVDVINTHELNNFSVSADHTIYDVDKWASAIYPSFSFLMQYRQNLIPKLYLNAKAGLKILGNSYSDVLYKDEVDIVHYTTIDASERYNPSVLLSLGLSYACKFALIDFNFVGNFSLGQFMHRTYRSNSDATIYSIEQSGTYYGIGISFHPKMWWKK